jgi:DNA-binding SARP family transcriptional activator/pimeloyl-ACP methyl ester carboxylesterase
MEIRVLGPMEASHEGTLLNLGGRMQRLVLALLVSRANEAVSTDHIVDDVWLDRPPRTARRTVQTYIATLRGVLEPCRPGTLTARRPGYAVNLDEDSLDAIRFERLLHEGRALAATDPESAVRLLREADDLWRGDAYAELGGAMALTTEVHRLHELRLTAIEARVDTELVLGAHSALVPELEALVDSHPLREGLRGQLMTALHRSGRQAEALRVYQRTRHVLGEELGIEPSPELRRIEDQILMQDGTLDLPSPVEPRPYVPKVRYAETSDGVRIAHYAIGSGDVDLVYVPGWVSNIETMWEHPLPARFLRMLASMGRLICFDKRGTGLSDRVPVDQLPDLEKRTDDVRAVLDATGSERAVIFGVSEGGPMAALFAATHPERTAGLILYGAYAARKPSAEYPWAPSADARNRWLNFIEQEWGGEVDLRTLAPSMSDDDEFRAYWSRYLRSGASPSAAVALGRMNTEADIRGVVGSISAPTLVLHRTGDLDSPVEGSRWLAANIPVARLVEFEGIDHLPQISSDEIMDAIKAFVDELAPASKAGVQPATNR